MPGPPNDVGLATNQLTAAARNPLTSSQAGILVNDAIATYCPNGPGAARWQPAFLP